MLVYDFPQVAFSRLATGTGVDQRVAKWLFQPTVETGFLYARLRYNLNLAQASPAIALSTVATPVLLIHRSGDNNIPAQQSDWLAARRPQATELWRIPGVGHVEAFSRETADFSRHVLAWFESHR